MQMAAAERQNVNHDLTVARVVTETIKRSKSPRLKLGEVTIPKQATDVEVMFLGKILLNSLDQSVRMANQLSKFKENYDIPEEDLKRLEEYKLAFELDFAYQKIAISNILATHPLAIVGEIKGFSVYQLGLIMSMVKDPRHFKHFSQLAVYSGVAPKNGRVVTLANMNILKLEKRAVYGKLDQEDDFTDFGFNVKLKARMYVIIDSLMRAKGFFYEEYLRAKSFLIEKNINEGKCYQPTDEQIKASKGILKKGEWYMKNILNEDGSVKIEKKHQSLLMFAHAGARWRQARNLMHIIYVEWLKLYGIEARGLYAMDYLGHSSVISLKSVLDFEKGQKQLKEMEKKAKIDKDYD